MVSRGKKDWVDETLDPVRQRFDERKNFFKTSSNISALTNLILVILFLSEKLLAKFKDALVGSNPTILLFVPIAK